MQDGRDIKAENILDYISTTLTDFRAEGGREVASWGMHKSKGFRRRVRP